MVVLGFSNGPQFSDTGWVSYDSILFRHYSESVQTQQVKGSVLVRLPFLQTPTANGGPRLPTHLPS